MKCPPERRSSLRAHVVDVDVDANFIAVRKPPHPLYRLMRLAVV